MRLTQRNCRLNGGPGENEFGLKFGEKEPPLPAIHVASALSVIDKVCHYGEPCQVHSSGASGIRGNNRPATYIEIKEVPSG